MVADTEIKAENLAFEAQSEKSGIINQVLAGDSFELLKNIDDNSVDMILTDPPYGIANEVKITRSRNAQKFGKAKPITHDFGEWDKFDGFEDFMSFTTRWVDLAVSKLRGGGMFVSFFDRDRINFLSHYLQSQYGFKCKGYFAFIKQNPVPQARKVKFMNGWEVSGMWQKTNGKLVFNYENGQQPDYVFLPICGGNERTEHPTQKPLKAVYPFIRYFTNKNDLILDPFAGSGTTLVAARKLGRRFIGIEKELKYVDIIHRRLEKFNLKRDEADDSQLGCDL